MTTPAGWYPDPAGSGGTRWWNGADWSEHTQPAAVTFPKPTYPVAAYSPAAPAQQQAPTGFLPRNRFSLLVVVFGVLYVGLAVAVHLVLFGLLPLVFAVQAVRAKEPMAIAAVVLAVGILVFAVAGFAGYWNF